MEIKLNQKNHVWVEDGKKFYGIVANSFSFLLVGTILAKFHHQSYGT